MPRDATLALARAAFDAQVWPDAFARFIEADAAEALDAADLDHLAAAAYLLGRDHECANAWTRAHQSFLEHGEVERATRCAFWLGFSANALGDAAHASGWFARGRRLLEDAGRDSPDCVEAGYLRLPDALQLARSGETAQALRAFSEIAALGQRHGESTLIAMGRLGHGRCLMHLGRPAEGLAMLDELLVALSLGEVSPLVVGTIYCSALEACHEIFDLRRAQEWTTAVTQWCEAQPAIVPFRGQCLVKRAEMMQLHGAWTDAMDEVRRACERLSNPPGQRAVGVAYYQEAELHRLRGELGAAEEAYRRASQVGRTPQPGLALLRLAQGQVDAAVVSIRGELAEARDNLRRAALLPAVVEITLAAGDLDTARRAAEELARNADMLGTPFLRATAGQAVGAVLLAEGDARSALAVLRQAWNAWQELEAPYTAARVRVLVGQAARALGDDDTAAMEFDAARCVLQQLGAAPDVALVASLERRGSATASGDLSARELQVLRLIAEGRTNRQIASRLMISEKTVARHVSNIFVKLGLSTRAAATAYAYEHELV